MSDEPSAGSPVSPAPAGGPVPDRKGRPDLAGRAREIAAKRGRPPKTAERADAGAAPGPDAGFSPDAVRAMVRLPFTVAYAGTGYGGWMLEAGEENQLAASGSVVLNTWVRVDPRWAALAAFSIALVSVASVKAVGFVIWRKGEEAKEAARASSARREAAAKPAGDEPPPAA